MGLYEQIKECAAKRGYSVNRLEQELGLPRSSLSKYNKSSPSLDKIRQIADFLKVPVGELIGEEQEDMPYYLNEDTKNIAQFLFENPEYRVLFDASRKVKREDIEFVKELIDRTTR